MITETNMVPKMEEFPLNKARFISDFFKMDAGNLRKTLEMGGINVEGANITPVDFFSIPKDITDCELETYIAERLDYRSVEDLGENKEESLEKINEFFDESRDFITRVLHQRLPREIENQKSFASKEEFLAFLRKATTLRKGSSVGYSPYYCAVASAMIAFAEIKKENVHELKKESAYVYDGLFDGIENEEGTGVTEYPLLRRIENHKAEYDPVFLMLPQKGERRSYVVTARMGFRGKTKDSMVEKALRKPEISSDEFGKDSIGIVIEFDVPEGHSMGEVGADVLASVISVLEKKHNFSDVVAENVCFYTEEQKKQYLQSIVKHCKTTCDLDVETKSDTGENKMSGKGFSSLKAIGKIEVPKNGKDDGLIVQRGIEAQIYAKGGIDKNMKRGLLGYHIYRARRLLSVHSRLFGSFPEEYLNLIVAEASTVSGIGEDKIKEDIIDNNLVTLQTKGSKSLRYCTKDHFERWVRAKQFPEGIMARDPNEENGVDGATPRRKKRKSKMKK